jgi:hypothetical protein
MVDMVDMVDYNDELTIETIIFGENQALENITVGLYKKDNIECCVCLNDSWGVKLPNCTHFICPKCYYKIYNGYVPSNFHIKNPYPNHPEISRPNYPYQNKDKNEEIFYSITENNKYLEWFMYENEDLYNSVKLNTEYVDNLDVEIKKWFEHNELLEKYENDLIQYEIQQKKIIKQFYIKIQKYDRLYYQEKINNAQKLCPLCRA